MSLITSPLLLDAAVNEGKCLAVLTSEMCEAAEKVAYLTRKFTAAYPNVKVLACDAYQCRSSIYAQITGFPTFRLFYKGKVFANVVGMNPIKVLSRLDELNTAP